jgi:hypothetical protein
VNQRQRQVLSVRKNGNYPKERMRVCFADGIAHNIYEVASSTAMLQRLA